MTVSSMDDLTLSIVSHGHARLLHNLLSDLDRIAAASRTRLQVIVTLNVPEPAPEPAQNANLRLQLIHNEQPKGFGANHNAAFRHCSTRWFAVLNPDLRLPSDPFPALLSTVDAIALVGVASPQVVNSVARVEDHVRRNLTPASLWRRRRGIAEPVDTARWAQQPAAFYWLAGMFLLFDSDAYRRANGFDERFYLYCEDYDVCARLYNAGYAIALVPGAKVVHDAQRDSHRAGKHLRWHVASLLKVWCSRAFWKISLARRS